MRSFKFLFFDGIVFLLYLFTIGYFIKFFGFIDIKDHNLLLSNYLSAGYFPIPPGYYFLVYALDMLIRIKYPFVVSSALVLSFFLWWKYKLLFTEISKSMGRKGPKSFLLSLSFLFLSPIFIPAIDGDFWYLGKFTQTIWHNSTLICVFPFCIVLTLQTLKWLESKDRTHLFSMSVLCFSILLIKPSFLFCFIPGLPIYILIRERKLSTQFIHSLLFISVIFLLLFLEKYLIFSWDPMINKLYAVDEISKVVINPLGVWLNFSNEPLFDFISSFPLLLFFLICWKKSAFETPYFNLSLLLLVFALLVYLLLAETGWREFHGNFYWQIPIALLINSLSILLAVIRSFRLEGRKWTPKYVAIALVYVIQVAMGLCYWLRIFVERTLS